MPIPTSANRDITDRMMEAREGMDLLFQILKVTEEIENKLLRKKIGLKIPKLGYFLKMTNALN